MKRLGVYVGSSVATGVVVMALRAARAGAHADVAAAVMRSSAALGGPVGLVGWSLEWAALDSARSVRAARPGGERR